MACSFVVTMIAVGADDGVVYYSLFSGLLVMFWRWVGGASVGMERATALGKKAFSESVGVGFYCSKLHARSWQFKEWVADVCGCFFYILVAFFPQSTGV